MLLGNTSFSITHYPEQMFFLLLRETNEERCLVHFDAQYVYKCKQMRRGFWGPALSAFVNMELVKVSLSVFRHFYIFFIFKHWKWNTNKWNICPYLERASQSNISG